MAVRTDKDLPQKEPVKCDSHNADVFGLCHHPNNVSGSVSHMFVLIRRGLNTHTFILDGLLGVFMRSFQFVFLNWDPFKLSSTLQKECFEVTRLIPFSSLTQEVVPPPCRQSISTTHPTNWWRTRSENFAPSTD